jgi:uncharacterized membrane protein
MGNSHELLKGTYAVFDSTIRMALAILFYLVLMLTGWIVVGLLWWCVVQASRWVWAQ